MNELSAKALFSETKNKQMQEGNVVLSVQNCKGRVIIPFSMKHQNRHLTIARVTSGPQELKLSW